MVKYSDLAVSIGVVFLFLTECGSQQYNCKDGWTKFHDSCYIFETTHADWIEAEQYCGIFGAALAEIDSQSESNFLETKIIAKHLHDQDRDDYSYWIGANDLEVEGEFVWAKSGKRLNYTDWEAGQPDDHIFDDYYPEDEDCVEMFAENGKWNDRPCSHKALFICEMPATIEGLALIGKRDDTLQ